MQGFKDKTQLKITGLTATRDTQHPGLGTSIRFEVPYLISRRGRRCSGLCHVTCDVVENVSRWRHKLSSHIKFSLRTQPFNIELIGNRDVELALK